MSTPKPKIYCSRYFTDVDDYKRRGEEPETVCTYYYNRSKAINNAGDKFESYLGVDRFDIEAEHEEAFLVKFGSLDKLKTNADDDVVVDFIGDLWESIPNDAKQLYCEGTHSSTLELKYDMPKYGWKVEGEIVRIACKVDVYEIQMEDSPLKV